MNLTQAYSKLFSIPNYSFIFTANGQVLDWEDCTINSTKQVHIVPGSFNPLHQTHKEIYSLIDAPSDISFFEMSVERVDKAVVTAAELEERLKQFIGYASVIVSRAPRFVMKIGTYLRHVENLTFHVGIDTIVRMADDYSVIGIQGLAAQFIIHNRIMDGKLCTLETEIGSFIPRNCSPSPTMRSNESMARSSTNIRLASNQV